MTKKTIRLRFTYTVAAISMIMIPASPALATSGFGDVEAELFYSQAVQWMVDTGITTGTSPTCFSPDRTVTRGEGAAFLHRMMGEPDGTVPHGFVDITEPWQQEPVSWMVAQGITTGTSSTTYSPDEGLSRGQFAALLHRLEGEPGASDHHFTDIAKDWQNRAVAWLFGKSITTGTSATTFSPDDPVTRGQLATFLHRYQHAPAAIVDPASPLCDLTRTPRMVTETGYQPFATTGTLTLVHPVARVEVIGFHESTHDGSQQMDTTLTVATNNTLDSRGRETGSRTAADIVVDPTSEIRSPITGTVIRSGGYVLYCDISDQFVVIEPDDQPGWEVKMFHINGLRVSNGDHVEAGITVLAGQATQLPFVSQIDGFSAEPSWPHVHVEVIDPSIPDRPGGGC